MRVAEAVVVMAEEVEEGGLEVPGGDGVFMDAVTEHVCFAVGVAFFDAGSGHEEGEGVGVVVPAEEAHFASAAVFLHGGAAEFGAPDDEGVFEEAALFEVGEEGGDGAVHLLAFVHEAAIEGFAVV